MPHEIQQLHPDEYPSQLLELPHIPKTIWMRGSWPPPDTKYLAVVGSRALSRYGKEACESLIYGLSGYPISIVSGLALGADAVAHRAALGAGLHTIAIPGSGLSETVLYPRSNASLGMDILDAGGALLSEHEANYNARPEDFPSRNRLMVGLSQAVLIIEAGDHSGTLITGRLASEYNRDLLCVPHRIGDTHGYGAQLFIRLGAGLVAEPSHILEALHINPRDESTRNISTADFTDNEKKIYELLVEPLPRDELIRKSTMETGAVLTALVSLEIRSLIKEEFGAWRRT